MREDKGYFTKEEWESFDRKPDRAIFVSATNLKHSSERKFYKITLANRMTRDSFAGGEQVALYNWGRGVLGGRFDCKKGIWPSMSEHSTNKKIDKEKRGYVEASGDCFFICSKEGLDGLIADRKLSALANREFVSCLRDMVEQFELPAFISDIASPAHVEIEVDKTVVIDRGEEWGKWS